MNIHSWNFILRNFVSDTLRAQPNFENFLSWNRSPWKMLSFEPLTSSVAGTRRKPLDTHSGYGVHHSYPTHVEWSKFKIELWRHQLGPTSSWCGWPKSRLCLVKVACWALLSNNASRLSCRANFHKSSKKIFRYKCNKVNILEPKSKKLKVQPFYPV